MNPVTIFKEKKEFIKSTNNMKLEIVEGKKSAIPIYNKSVFEITFEADNIAELTSYEKKLTEAGNKITEKIQLSHPNPREYAYMGVLMSRVKGGPYLFKFLKKYWYPTFKLSTFEANKVTYQFSVSPTLDLEEVSKIISETIGKRNKVEVKIKGFLNMIDPRVFAIFNMGSLVYNEGDEIPL